MKKRKKQTKLRFEPNPHWINGIYAHTLINSKDRRRAVIILGTTMNVTDRKYDMHRDNVADRLWRL